MNPVQPADVSAHLFEDDGAIPNNPALPFLVYRSALEIEGAEETATAFENVFAGNGWGGAWRDGVYSYPHYHSTAHEVLGVCSGEARLRLGGGTGIEIAARAGDVIVIPAGGGHQNLGAGPDFLVVGAYPAGQVWDLCRGHPQERPRVLDNIARVPLPQADPVYGARGPLAEHWKERL